MSWLGNVLGTAGSETVNGALNGVGDAAVKVRQAITGELPPEMQVKMAELDQTLLVAQAEIDKLEAGNASLFVSGWRPFLGWICGISMAIYYIPRFILGTFFWSKLAWESSSLPAMPEMGIGDIVGLVTALLGMAVIRSVDLKAGTARR